MSVILQNQIKPKIPILLKKKSILEPETSFKEDCELMKPQKGKRIRECGICYQTYEDCHLSKYELNLCFHDICYQCSSRTAETVKVDPEGICLLALYKCPFCRLCSYGYLDSSQKKYRWGCISEETYFNLSYKNGMELFVYELKEKKRQCSQCNIDFEYDFDQQWECWNCLI